MLETLLKILSSDQPGAAVIILEDDGDILLDYLSGEILISIGPAGGVNWTFSGGPHGTGLDEFSAELTSRGLSGGY